MEDTPAKRSTVSFPSARAVLTGAVLFFAVTMALRPKSSISTSAAEVVTRYVPNWANMSNDQQCGLYDNNDFTAVQGAFEKPSPPSPTPPPPSPLPPPPMPPPQSPTPLPPTPPTSSTLVDLVNPLSLNAKSCPVIAWWASSVMLCTLLILLSTCASNGKAQSFQLQVTGTGRTIMVNASPTMPLLQLQRIVAVRTGVSIGSFSLYHCGHPMSGTMWERGVSSGSTIELKLRGRGGVETRSSEHVVTLDAVTVGSEDEAQQEEAAQEEEREQEQEHGEEEEGNEWEQPLEVFGKPTRPQSCEFSGAEGGSHLDKSDASYGSDDASRLRMKRDGHIVRDGHKLVYDHEAELPTGGTARSWVDVPECFRKVLGRGWVTNGLNVHTLALADMACNVFGPLVVISPEGKLWHFTPYNKILEANESCARLQSTFDSLRFELVERQNAQEAMDFDTLLKHRIQIDLSNPCAQEHFHATFAKGVSHPCKGYQLNSDHIRKAIEKQRSWCKLVPFASDDPILLAKDIVPPPLFSRPLEVDTPRGEIESIVSYHLEKIHSQRESGKFMSVIYKVRCMHIAAVALDGLNPPTHLGHILR